MSYMLTAADYSAPRGVPLINLMSRDSHGKRAHFQIDSFKPYFYAPLANVAEPLDVMESVDHIQVSKVMCDLPSEVVKMREMYPRHFEADILFPWRYLIDKDIRSGFDVLDDGSLIPADDNGAKLSKMYLDIEVEVTGRPIDPVAALDMILAIGYSMNGEEPTILTAESEVEEIDILRQIGRIVQKEDPDIITGWNVFYDLATIIGRSRHNSINPHAISPLGYVDIRYPHIKVQGRNVLDMLACFKQYHQNKVFPSFKLDDIAARPEYGFGYTNDEYFDYKNKMNRNHLDIIVPYNKEDVQKLIDIDRHLELIDQFDAVRKTAGCSLDDSLTIARYAGMMFLREYHGHYVVPSGRHFTKREKFEGAHVVQPMMGIFNWVATFDFARMYPSIIISHNMSPETLVRNPENYSKDEMYEINGVYFLREPMGIAVKMLERLNDARNVEKRKMKGLDTKDPKYKIHDLKQYSFKQMTAAVYGYFAYPGSRVYCPEISSSTTFIGRKLAHQCIDYINKAGFKVLYGDTDSVLASMPVNNLDEAIRLGDDMEAQINQMYIDIAKAEGWRMPAVMEFEQVYNPLLFSGVKKRYAGRCLYYKGKPADEIIIKGFEAKRSDSSKETQFIQTEVLELILNGHSEKEVRASILGALTKYKKKGISEVGIPKPLKKNLSEYTGGPLSGLVDILYANKYLGKKFERDSRPYRFFIKRTPEGLPTSMLIGGKWKKVNRIALDAEDDLSVYDGIIDWNLQGIKIIENKVEPILRAYGLSMSEVRSGQKQMKLGDYR